MMKRLLTPAFAIVFVAMSHAGALAQGDVKRGENVFRKCASCHAVGIDPKRKTGPQLNGVLGRTAASVDGARYSKALKDAAAAGLIWDEDTLDAFLTNPRAYLKGTRMSFRGLKDEADRADVIAYLGQFSDTGLHLDAGQDAAEAYVTVPPEVLALVGDAGYGEYLSGECTTCHQANGGDQGIPPITNWPVESFVVAMHAYREKTREHPVMNMVAGRLGDDEIAALAAYFATLEN